MPNAATEKYDPRTLYEKLQEQKDMKQAAFEDKISIRKLSHSCVSQLAKNRPLSSRDILS